MVTVSVDGSTSKVESMKPLILKAGIPLAISVAGYVLAKVLKKGDSGHNASLPDSNQVKSLESNSEPSAFYEEDLNSADTLQISNDQEDEILRLRAWCEETQKRENELMSQFVRYRELKEKESKLVEMKTNLLVEKAHAEFFRREVSSLEAENRRVEYLVIQYLRFLEQIQGLEAQNKALQQKVERLLRRSKTQAGVIKQKNLKINATEKELLSTLNELGAIAAVVKKLEDEGAVLKVTASELQEQNNELQSKLNSIPEIERGGVTITDEDYKQLLNEYENLQASRAAEVKELIFLRWSNACLRHEFMRNQTPQEHGQETKTLMEIIDLQDEEHGSGESGSNNATEGLALTLEHKESSFRLRHAESDHRVCSRRRKILNKLRRWVDGTDKKPKGDEKDKNESNCFGRHSTSDRAEEDCHVLARRSCSSV